MTATNNDPIPPDNRSIDEMPFGSGAPDPAATAILVRGMLRQCGVTVAHEIEELGCTGASAKGLTTTQIAELRLGLGGGGVGLPCFVPPDRYCLAHSTIGGLQIGQLGRFQHELVKISRSLSPRERGQIELTEAARRVRGGDLSERLLKTTDALSGRELPPGVEMGGLGVGEDDHEGVLTDISPEDLPAHYPPPRAWTCPEHRVPVWSCRYCVAQMIVEGPLAPQYAADPHFPAGSVIAVVPDVASFIEGLRGDVEKVEIYALVATFRRKLARD